MKSKTMKTLFVMFLSAFLMYTGGRSQSLLLEPKTVTVEETTTVLIESENSSLPLSNEIDGETTFDDEEVKESFKTTFIVEETTKYNSTLTPLKKPTLKSLAPNNKLNTKKRGEFSGSNQIKVNTAVEFICSLIIPAYILKYGY